MESQARNSFYYRDMLIIGCKILLSNAVFRIVGSVKVELDVWHNLCQLSLFFSHFNNNLIAVKPRQNLAVISN